MINSAAGPFYIAVPRKYPAVRGCFKVVSNEEYQNLITEFEKGLMP